MVKLKPVSLPAGPGVGSSLLWPPHRLLDQSAAHWGTEADTRNRCVWACVYMCLFTQSSTDSERNQKVLYPENTEIKNKTGYLGKNNLGTGEILLSPFLLNRSQKALMIDDWRLPTGSGSAKWANVLQCSGQAVAGKMISAFVSDIKDAHHCSAMCYFPSSCSCIFLGNMYMIDNGITFLF